MWEDPIVSDVRRVREELAARFDFDVKAIFADIRQRQTLLGERLVSRKERAEPAGARGRKPPSTPEAISESSSTRGEPS